MSKRILSFGTGVTLSTKLEQLVITFHDSGLIQTEHISDLAAIEIDSLQSSITAYCMYKLAEKGVIVVFSGANHCPVSIAIPTDANERQTEIILKQSETKITFRKSIWKQVVAAKINNQARLMEYNSMDSAYLKSLIDKIGSGDTTNREGIAAAHYWKHIFSDRSFRRDPEGHPPNHLLNYGYAIVRAITARAIASAGLCATFGIHHKGPRNAFCLADDLMEPYRPYVDKIVIELYREDPIMLIMTKEQKRRLLEIIYLELAISGEKKTLMNAIHDTVESYVNCIYGKSKKLKLPEL